MKIIYFWSSFNKRALVVVLTRSAEEGEFGAAFNIQRRAQAAQGPPTAVPRPFPRCSLSRLHQARLLPSSYQTHPGTGTGEDLTSPPTPTTPHSVIFFNCVEAVCRRTKPSNYEESRKGSEEPPSSSGMTCSSQTPGERF